MYRQTGKNTGYRVLWTGKWILVGFFMIPAFAVGQTNEQPSQQNQVPNQPNQAVIDEINSIRQQLGGGIAEQLKGLDFGKPIEGQLKADFDQELGRLTSQPPLAKPPTKPGIPSSVINRGSDQVMSAANGQTALNVDTRKVLHSESDVARPGLDSRISNKGLSMPSHFQVVQLRSSARRLDEIAAELEEVELYREADTVREQARDFWLKARKFEIQ